MLISRVASGLTFLAIILLGLYHPSLGFIVPLVALLAGLWATHEFTRFGMQPMPPPWVALALGGAALVILDAWVGGFAHAMALLGGMAILGLGLGVFIRRRETPEWTGRAIAGTIYVALPMAIIVHLFRTGGDAGAAHIVFLVSATWASDIGAYFTGRAIGRHKLAPSLSPGKTVEGLLGGVALSLFVAAALVLFVPGMDAILTLPHAMALGLVFSIIGPIGDLAVSHMKRSSGMKDSGRTFTGHGGMLDIIDSLLFTTLIYYLDHVYF